MNNSTIIKGKIKRKSIYDSIVGLIIAFLIMIIPYLAMYIKYEFYIGYEGAIQAFATAILFAVVGAILWSVIHFKYKKKLFALGFFIGGLFTILTTFVLPSSRP